MRHVTMKGLALLVVFGVVACAGSDSLTTVGQDYSSEQSPGTDLSDDSTRSRNSAESPEEGSDYAWNEETGEFTVDASQKADASLGSGGTDPSVLTPADLGRDIVYRADITVAVNDVEAAGREATTVIASLGGFLFGQQTTAGYEPRTVLVLKVFPEDFQTALDRLGAIGELRNQNVTADDVTERVVDLESRIRTAEASVERLRELLSDAKDFSVIADIENRLLERETSLELLRGQLRTLQDQVALATIILTIVEDTIVPSIDIELSVYEGHDGDGIGCPGNSYGDFEQGTEYTLCLVVTNDGDHNLAGLTLRDPVLDVELEDWLVVQGDPEEIIEPGESVTLALELIAERRIATRTTVTANPVDAEGNPLPGEEATAQDGIVIDAYEPDGIPSFGEGFEKSVNALADFGRFLLLTLALAIPFLWVPVLLWMVLWILRKRRGSETAPTTRVEEAESVKK